MNARAMLLALWTTGLAPFEARAAGVVSCQVLNYVCLGLSCQWAAPLWRSLLHWPLLLLFALIAWALLIVRSFRGYLCASVGGSMDD